MVAFHHLLVKSRGRGCSRVMESVRVPGNFIAVQKERVIICIAAN